MPEDTVKQPEGTTIDPRVKEVHDLVREYKDAAPRIKWLERYEKCWDAIENDMFTEKEKKEAREQEQDELIINKLVKGVQGSSAIVTDQKPEIKALPVGSSDLYVAELIKRGHDLVWTRNEGLDVTYEVVEETKIGGLGFFDIQHDPNLGIFGRIVMEEGPPDDMYFDKDSRRRDFSDTHIIKAKYRTKSYIKENYPDISEEDMIYDPELREDFKSSGVTGEDNYAIGTETSKPDSTEDRIKEPKNILEAEAWLLKTKKEDWVIMMPQGPGQEPTAGPVKLTPEEKKGLKAWDAIRKGKYWPRTMKKRVQRIVVGKKLIEEHENPYGEDRDGNPLMRFVALKHQRTRTAYPMSPTFYALPLNGDKNKRRMQFALAISHNVNSPIIEPAGHVKWEGVPGTPGSRIKVDDNAPFIPTRLQGGTVDATRFLELDRLDGDDINDMYDMHDVMRGKIPQGTDPSGRVVLALQDMGGMMSKPFLRALESALIRVGKVNIAMMLKYWPRYMWEKLIEDDEMKRWTPQGQLEWKQPHGPDEEEAQQMDIIHDKWMDAIEKIKPADDSKKGITLLDLDVKIVAGSSMPTNRIAKAGLAIDYVKVGIYDAEAALKYVDDPERDNILRRLKEKEEQLMQQEMMKMAK